uniref:DUF3391 domain-containing protein n=1 Tax=Ralstonia pseudosolanacearum TaxID=1310165 RepID=UPI003221B3BB
MRKRIAIEHLQVGMYLEEFVDSWLDHPFWRARFRVEDTAQLQRLRASGIREVWIDTSRGKDVAAGAAAPAAADMPGLTFNRLAASRNSVCPLIAFA